MTGMREVSNFVLNFPAIEHCVKSPKLTGVMAVSNCLAKRLAPNRQPNIGKLTALLGELNFKGCDATERAEF